MGPLDWFRSRACSSANGAPDDLKHLGGIDFKDLYRGDCSFWDLSVRKVVEAAGLGGPSQAPSGARRPSHVPLAPLQETPMSASESVDGEVARACERGTTVVHAAVRPGGSTSSEGIGI